MDPSLYISRFAALLEFQDETQKVAHDATRLVQRFSRDWMDTGRRPAGICGACLLLAARMNNFRRSVEEIVQVVKIADTTLRKRLDEFKATASGGLSISDFRSMWLEETHDPPAYIQGQKKLKKMKKLESEEPQAESSSQAAKRSRSRSTSALPSSASKGKGKERLDTLDKEDYAFGSPAPPADSQSQLNAVFQAAADFNDGDALPDEQEDEIPIDPSILESNASSASASSQPRPPSSAVENREDEDSVEKGDKEGDENDGLFDSAISNELSDFLSTKQAQQLSTELTMAERRREERRQNATGDLELDDIDEAELDGFLLTDQEVQVKTRLWMEYNKDYLEKLARQFPPLRSDFEARSGNV